MHYSINPWVRNCGDKQYYMTSLDVLVWKNTVQKRVAKWGQYRKSTFIVVVLKWWSLPRWYLKLKENDLRFIQHIKRLFQTNIKCNVSRIFLWSILKWNENPICDAFFSRFHKNTRWITFIYSVGGNYVF